MAPLLLVLLLAETGPPPDPYEPLIFQMMLHEVVIRALEPVVPRIPLVALPGAVTVPVPPTPAAAGVPAPVVVRPPVTEIAGVPGVVEVKAPAVPGLATGPAATKVGAAPAGVPGAVAVNAPSVAPAGVPGTVATRVGVAPAGVPGAVEVKVPVTGTAGVPGTVTVQAPAVPGLAVGPAATKVGAAPAGVPGVAEVKAPVTGIAGVPGAVTVQGPVTGTAGVPGAVATRVGVAPAGVPGVVEVKAPVTGQVSVPGVAGVRVPDRMPVAVGAVGTDAALIAALAAGDRSPERQAQLAALPDAYLFGLLDHLPLLPWSEPAGDALAAALLSRGVAVIDSRQWSYTATMHLAGALARQRDERCVTLYEELLGRREGQAQGSVLELIHLARYYESVRRYEQASETFLRHEQFSRFTNENANCCVEAARCLVQAGYAQRAWVLYERVADYGYGWATGLAAADRAGFLQRAGRPAEALALLRQPVMGALSERVAIVLAMQEALCYLALGQAAEARESYFRALEIMERLQVPPDWEHLGEHLAWIRPTILGKE